MNRPPADLDHIDRQILGMLEGDARLPVAAIARQLKMTPPAIGERLNKLRDAGVVRGYRTRLDRAQVGRGLAAFAEFTPFGGDIERTVARLADFPQITSCYRVTGNAFLVLFITVASNEGLNDLLRRLSMLGQTRTSVVLNVEFEDRPYLPASAAPHTP